MSTSSSQLLARIVARTRLRHWQLAKEIALLGSIQKAAAAVGLSQPAATSALLELERLVGFAFFERHAKGTRLSPAGEAVMPKVMAALESFSEMAEVVSAVLQGSSAEIRIGAIGAAISGVLAPVLVDFSRTHASVTVQVLRQRPGQLLASLREGTIDLAVCRRPAQLPAGVLFDELLDDRNVLACAPGHPLAGRAEVTLEELSAQLWLAPPKSTIAEQDYERMWGELPPPRWVCRVESQEPLILWTMLEERQALAFVPYNVVRPWVERGLLVVLPGPRMNELQPIGLLSREGLARQPGPLGDLIARLLRAKPAA